MNSYGDQVSHDLKLKVCAKVLRESSVFPPGVEVERIHDHEGPWKVTDRAQNLHYLGREPLPEPTHPDFQPPFKSPCHPKDPSKLVGTTYWKNATTGKYNISDERIAKYYNTVDRRYDIQTRGFRFSTGNQGSGRVSVTHSN